MRSLLTFFLLTFIFSWSFFIIAAIISRNANSLDSGFSPIGYFIYLIGIFAPALVTIFLSWREEGKAGVLALTACPRAQEFTIKTVSTLERARK
jgi:hypothetical protein